MGQLDFQRLKEQSNDGYLQAILQPDWFHRRKILCNSTKSENVPKDLAPTRVSYVESKIESCIQVFQSWAPMFEDKENLYSLSSGYHAHENMRKIL